MKLRNSIITISLGALFLVIGSSAAYASNYEQVCTCIGNNSNTLSILNAYWKAVESCTCWSSTGGADHIVEPPACPTGLTQIGSLVKRNCQHATGTFDDGSYRGGACLLNGATATCNVSCEIVRVCGTAVGN